MASTRIVQRHRYAPAYMFCQRATSPAAIPPSYVLGGVKVDGTGSQRRATGRLNTKRLRLTWCFRSSPRRFDARFDHDARLQSSSSAWTRFRPRSFRWATTALSTATCGSTSGASLAARAGRQAAIRLIAGILVRHKLARERGRGRRAGLPLKALGLGIFSVLRQRRLMWSWRLTVVTFISGLKPIRLLILRGEQPTPSRSRCRFGPIQASPEPTAGRYRMGWGHALLSLYLIRFRLRTFGRSSPSPSPATQLGRGPFRGMLKALGCFSILARALTFTLLPMHGLLARILVPTAQPAFSPPTAAIFSSPTSSWRLAALRPRSIASRRRRAWRIASGIIKVYLAF